MYVFKIICYTVVYNTAQTFCTEISTNRTLRQNYQTASHLPGEHYKEIIEDDRHYVIYPPVGPW